MDEEILLDVTQDEAIGLMFKSDELPIKKEIVLPDGSKATVEVDQTSLTLSTKDGKTITLTVEELIKLMESIKMDSVFEPEE